jgi:nucleotide-binding universal stress UspA family protein
METVKPVSRLAVASILFATDFSEASQRALGYASSFAGWFGAKLFILHAVPPEPHYGVPLDRLPEELDPLWQEAREKMAHLELAPSLKGVAHDTIVEQGTPPDSVLHIVRKKKIDLVVLGTRGRRGLKKLLLGSEAEAIFRQTSCPVLTIGPEVNPPAPGGWKLKTILFPTDLSPNSLLALPYALSLAEENQAALIVLHLSQVLPYSSHSAIEADLIDQLRKLLPAEAEDWCRPECMVRFEAPARGILQVAEDRNADLIVMAVRKPATPSTAAHSPWHTASEVVGAARCPVLTVRG